MANCLKVDFSNRLTELLEEKGLMQKELAKACGLSAQCVSALITGRNNPTGSTLIALANYLDCSSDFLLGLENDFSPMERAAGLSETAKAAITPLEDDLLYAFRKIGKKHGEEAQRALITVAEKML